MKRLSLLCAAALLAACSQSVPPHRPQVRPLQPQPVPAAPSAQDVPVVSTGGINVLNLPGKNQPGYVNPYPAGSYEHFVAQPAYPNTSAVFKNEALLPQITSANSKVIICIPQQRARVYVNGRVAMDWPVSTGTNGHETPTGVFRILEKKPDHHSNRYGKFISGGGKTTNSNADLANGLPDGASFQGAAMPFWNRLTWDGVGIHAGKVVPGKRLSHGCIRTPRAAAEKFYSHSVVGMPVYITRAVEDYAHGGAVRPIDVKYRPIPGNDYTDVAPATVKHLPAAAAAL